jgi:hypothetical protein
MIHNTVHEIVIVFRIVIILYILYMFMACYRTS